jgi:hypothetical protein
MGFPDGTVNEPGNVGSALQLFTVQAPLAPHDGGFKLMLDPLMSSMRASAAGPVHKLAASLVSRSEGASTETLESAARSRLASATTGELDDEAQPTNPKNVSPAVARPTMMPRERFVSLWFISRSFRSSPSTANHRGNASARSPSSLCPTNMNSVNLSSEMMILADEDIHSSFEEVEPVVEIRCNDLLALGGVPNRRGV